MTAQGRAALHKEMLSRIADLESLITELGHARPPITEQDFLKIKDAIATLKAQPVDPIPIGDYIKATVATSTLEKIAAKSVENKQDLPYWLAQLYIHLTRLAQSVCKWIRD